MPRPSGRNKQSNARLRGPPTLSNPHPLPALPPTGLTLIGALCKVQIKYSSSSSSSYWYIWSFFPFQSSEIPVHLLGKKDPAFYRFVILTINDKPITMKIYSHCRSPWPLYGFMLWWWKRSLMISSPLSNIQNKNLHVLHAKIFFIKLLDIYLSIKLLLFRSY